MTLSKKTGQRITFKEYLMEAYQEMKGTAINMLEQHSNQREHGANYHGNNGTDRSIEDQGIR